MPYTPPDGAEVVLDFKAPYTAPDGAEIVLDFNESEGQALTGMFFILN